MPFVDPAHHGKIGRRHRPGQRDAAAADPRLPKFIAGFTMGRSCDRSIIVLRPGMPAEPAHLSKNHSTKFMFCVNSLDLRLERLQSHRCKGAGLGSRPEYSGGPAHKRRLPPRPAGAE